MMRNRVPLLPGAGLILALLAALFAGTPRSAEATRTFPETGYTIWGPFEEYWEANGGLKQFGLPRTSVYPAGDNYDAQWFERALFTYTPGNPDPFKVQLQLLGAMYSQPRASEAAFQAATKGAGGQFFAETGHNLSGKFLEYWQATGGLPIYGYPVSEEFMEKSAIDGKMYRVQYFERNRFEYHPENAGTPFEVQLGLLGSELLDRAGGPEAIEKLGGPKFYPPNIIVPPGQIVTPIGGTPEPFPTQAPPPPAPALPTSSKQVMFETSFSSGDLSNWQPVALGPGGEKAASWRVSNGVLLQAGSAGDESAEDETVLLLPQRNVENFTLDTYFYATSGDPVGAVFRHGDRGYYLLQIYGQVQNDRPKATLIQVVPGAQGKAIANSGTWAGYTRGAWHRLTITANGANFTIAIDGQQIMQGSEPTFKAGAIGLYSWASGSARFDNLRVTAP